MSPWPHLRSGRTDVAAANGCDTRWMTEKATADPSSFPPETAGEHEQRLALGASAQQIASMVATLSMLAAITILARRLSLPKFGTYGLLVSLTAYVLFVQASIETASVKAIAEAIDQRARDRAFSIALGLYLVAGLVTGGILAAAGGLLLDVLNVPPKLHHQAFVSVLALSAVTAVGWPFKVFHDVLRGCQLFAASATSEGVAYVLVALALIGLALDHAELWLLVAAGASVPLAIGVISAVVALLKRLPYRFRKEVVTLDSVRGFTSLSAYVFLGGIAALVIYSLDRAVLAIFRSPAAVGLYEGPVRAHNFIQQVDIALASPVVPASVRYTALNDVQRTRDLLVRGMRYTLAAAVPLTIAVMILAKPILTVWLGAKFAVAATAMTLLASYWLINGNTSVPGRMLIAAGRIRVLTLYSVAVACLNLGLSIALTPSFGINGVVLGTTISYLLGFPFFLWIVLSTFPVRIAELAREVWLPAYVTGALVAAPLLAIRLTVPLDALAEVVAAGVIAIIVYWAIYYAVWLRPNERVLVKSVARTLALRQRE
jgi:O-antigen/teichoic acid export membrane protein